LGQPVNHGTAVMSEGVEVVLAGCDVIPLLKYTSVSTE
jgi:hypothetical protein